MNKNTNKKLSKMSLDVKIKFYICIIRRRNGVLPHPTAI